MAYHQEIPSHELHCVLSIFDDAMVSVFRMLEASNLKICLGCGYVSSGETVKRFFPAATVEHDSIFSLSEEPTSPSHINFLQTHLSYSLMVWHTSPSH